MAYKNPVPNLSILLLLLLTINPAFAVGIPVPPDSARESRAVRINPAPPPIDGKLDDKAWKKRRNGVWKRPHSWNWWASLNTDRCRKVSFNFNPGGGRSRYGSW